jgi:predicted DCC family thiol-disulfide oxidoreductase YuxK
MKRLTVVYDAACPLCVRCRDWMEEQAAYVELEFLPSSSSEAIRRYGEVPWLGAELVVVSDGGDVWVGSAAFLVALWALEDYREWSYRLSGGSFSKMAERFFMALSHRRRWIAGWLSHPRCTSDRCRRVGSVRSAPYR